jgi:hypothetical protein
LPSFLWLFQQSHITRIIYDVSPYLQQLIVSSFVLIGPKHSHSNTSNLNHPFTTRDQDLTHRKQVATVRQMLLHIQGNEVPKSGTL